MRGMAPMKNSVTLVLEAMCICLGLEPTHANAITLFNDRDINVKKKDRESIVLSYDVKLRDYLTRNSMFENLKIGKCSKLCALDCNYR